MKELYEFESRIYRDMMRVINFLESKREWSEPLCKQEQIDPDIDYHYFESDEQEKEGAATPSQM